MKSIVLLLLAASLAIACGTPADPASAITSERILSHVTALAADEMEGRAPGTVGEERAVAYLVREFERLGLKPGNSDGTFTQRVPLIGFRGQATGSVQIKGKSTPLRIPEDAIAVSRQGLPDVAVTNSDIVFVGYGVVAPELGWDDFKGVDVRGKTIVMLVGDPPVPDAKDPSTLDPAVFKGAAMTYYGRWAYKYKSPPPKARPPQSSCMRRVRPGIPTTSSSAASIGRTSALMRRGKPRATRPLTPG